MNRAYACLVLTLSCALGCGASSTPPAPADTGISTDIATDATAPTDLGATDVQPPPDAPAPDAPFTCALPGGGTCMAGQSCRHPDGCNTCTCYDRSGLATCTTLGCAPDGGAPGGCRYSTDCRPGDECRFRTAGCGMLGTCSVVTDCASVQAWCGCDGMSFRDCPGAPVRPWASMGACATDGGAPSDAMPLPDAAVCAGASIAPSGYCAGPADRALPNSCCTHWPCDTRAVTCERLPPTCAAGEVPAVNGSCYGPCVPADHCATIACSDSACPARWHCSSGACVFDG